MIIIHKGHYWLGSTLFSFQKGKYFGLREQGLAYHDWKLFNEAEITYQLTIAERKCNMSELSMVL